MAGPFPTKRPSWPWYFPGIGKMSTEFGNCVYSNEQYARVKRRELEEFMKKKSAEEEARKPLVRTPSTLHPKMKARNLQRWTRLVREVNELQAKLPENMQMEITDDKHIVITVHVEEFFYRGGVFDFLISIPDTYNCLPPGVKCITPIFHPAIDEKTGLVNLKILEKYPMHDQWKLNNKRLVHLIEGLQSLFKLCLCINTPINMAALDMYRDDFEKFVYDVERHVLALRRVRYKRLMEMKIPSKKLPKYDCINKIDPYYPGCSGTRRRL